MCFCDAPWYMELPAVWGFDGGLGLPREAPTPGRDIPPHPMAEGSPDKRHQVQSFLSFRLDLSRRFFLPRLRLLFAVPFVPRNLVL